MDRRGYIGGSDIAAIFGLSPWQTAYDLWEQKTATEYVEPVIEPHREKLYRRGKKLEPWVMELLEEERDIYICKRNQRYSDPEFPWMQCEIDFEYMADSGICNGDVKTVSPFAASEWGEEGTDEIPTYYALQFLWGQMITGSPVTMVAALIGADDLRVYEIKRDDELIAEIRHRASEFWNTNVIKGIPPPPQDAGDTHKILAKYGGFITPGNNQVYESVRRLKGIKAAEKRLKDAKEKYELSIKQFLIVQAEALAAPQDQERFVINGPDGKRLVTFAKQERAGYTVQPTSFYTLRT